MASMELRQSLAQATRNLASNQLSNEAQVKSAVILPILRALGWNDADPSAILPEYKVRTRFVDYALLDRGTPLIFIEAKRIGGIDVGAETQLFDYATNRGVPILILTDGNRWDFYLSMAEGLPPERRFYRLELELEQNINEYADFLLDHVERSRVISGEARRSAESRHASNRGRARARKALEGVWTGLCEEPDEFIRDYLAEEVEKSCGTKPDLQDVEQFLRESIASRVNIGKKQPANPPGGAPDPSMPKVPKGGKRTRIMGFTYRGERVETGTAKATLVEVLKRFAASDDTFLERYSSITRGRSRKFVSRNRAELYPNSPYLIELRSENLGKGWWLGTNLSADNVRSLIDKACIAAGVSGLELIET